MHDNTVFYVQGPNMPQTDPFSMYPEDGCNRYSLLVATLKSCHKRPFLVLVVVVLGADVWDGSGGIMIFRGSRVDLVLELVLVLVLLRQDGPASVATSPNTRTGWKIQSGLKITTRINR